MLHQGSGHGSPYRATAVHQSPARFCILEFCFEYRFHGAEGAVGRGGAGVHRTADGSEHMGCQLCEPLHVLEAGVEITAGDHGAFQGLQQFCGHVDQLILHGGGFLGPRHDLAAGKTGAVKIVLVGHQAGQSLAVGDTGFIAGVVQQAQSTVGGSLGIGVLGHHKHREMFGDVFRQHRNSRCGSGCGGHQATFSIIWWCST